MDESKKGEKGESTSDHKIEIIKSDMNEEMISEIIKITGAHAWTK